MTASLVMDPSPMVLQDDETIAAGMALVMKHRYRNIPVVDAGGRYLGIFGVHSLLSLALPKAVLVEGGLTSVPFVAEGLRDLRQRLKDVEDNPVTSCVTQDVEVVAPDTHLVETLLVLHHTRSSVPVVETDSKRLVGMVSYWDVLQKILEQEI